MNASPLYPRILLKLTGEAFLGEHEFGIARKALEHYAAEVHAITTLGVEVGIVLGGGNLFRGRDMEALHLHRVTSDTIGILATVMNALAFCDTLQQQGLKAVVFSAREIPGLVKGFERETAIRYLKQGFVVLFAGGTGNPLCTTDAAASLRAIEIEASILLKGTNVDGIYDKNPKTHADARLYRHITYDEALTQQLAVMDTAAFSQCKDFKLPIRVFNAFETGLLKRIIQGEAVGTLVALKEPL